MRIRELGDKMLNVLENNSELTFSTYKTLLSACEFLIEEKEETPVSTSFSILEEKEERSISSVFFFQSLFNLLENEDFFPLLGSICIPVVLIVILYCLYANYKYKGNK